MAIQCLLFFARCYPLSVCPQTRNSHPLHSLSYLNSTTYTLTLTSLTNTIQLEATIDALRERLATRQKEAADLKAKYNLGQ